MAPRSVMPIDDETVRQPMESASLAALPEAARVVVAFPPALAGAAMRLGAAELTLGRSPGPGGLALDHATVSRRHAAIRWSRGAHHAADLGSRNGSRVGGAALSTSATTLADGDVLRIGDVLLVYERGAGVDALDPPEVSRDAIPGGAAATLRLRAAVAAAARDPSPVLLCGETGTGKELVAREIHRLSGRSGPWLAVNCAAISRELVESQLFGHKRGAFTGADADRDGLFRAAGGGTLLLDEIGELDISLQAKLLRVLQEREVLPVGATRPIAVDVRVVAATLRNLGELAARGEFRLDLYARLSAWEIALPPLRGRRADVLGWIERFERQWHERRGRTSSGWSCDANAAERLLLHAWPDNLRGLERLVHQAAGAGGAYDVTPALAVPAAPSATATSPTAAAAADVEPRSRRDRPTKAELERALEENGGSVRATAKALGRERRLIYRWMELYGLRSK